MAKYHIIAQSDIEASFAAHTWANCGLGEPTFMDQDSRDICDDPDEVQECGNILLSDGYIIVRTIGDASIFVCCSAPQPAETP
jgi:hypothetical protein